MQRTNHTTSVSDKDFALWSNGTAIHGVSYFFRWIDRWKRSNRATRVVCGMMEEWRIDCCGHNGADVNIRSIENFNLGSQAFSQCTNTKLRGSVCAVIWSACGGDHRCVVDKDAMALFAEVGENGACTVCCSKEICLYNFAVHLCWNFLKTSEGSDASIIDPHINVPKAFKCLTCEILYCLLVADIGDYGQRISTA